MFKIWRVSTKRRAAGPRRVRDWGVCARFELAPPTPGRTRAIQLGAGPTRSAPLEDGHHAHRFVEADDTAAVLGEAQARAPDLSRSRLAAKLFRELGDHGCAGGADGVAFRDETARSVQGNLAAGSGLARLDEAPSFTLGTESQHLALVEVGKGGGVVHFGDVDVGGRDARLVIGPLRRGVTQPPLFEGAVLATAQPR